MSEVNLNRFLADRIRKAGEGLTAAIEKMPDEKIAWHPKTSEGEGRDALDQALECAYLNEWVAEGYRTQISPQIDWEDYKVQCDKRRNKADCVRWLHSSTNSLADAVESFPAAKLGETCRDTVHNIDTTWANFAIDLFYWNTVYHEGQVNYIQVLYGDLS